MIYVDILRYFPWSKGFRERFRGRPRRRLRAAPPGPRLMVAIGHTFIVGHPMGCAQKITM